MVHWSVLSYDCLPETLQTRTVEPEIQSPELEVIRPWTSVQGHPRSAGRWVNPETTMIDKVLGHGHFFVIIAIVVAAGPGAWAAESQRGRVRPPWSGWM